MDEALKRRLVGALVLLSLAFGLASLLPDPRPGAARVPAVVTYDLRTGKPVARHDQPPAIPTATDVEPEERQAAAPAEPAVRPTLKVDDTLGGEAYGWYVQVGSFESQGNARRVLETLYGLGLPTTIQSVSVGRTLWYRVRVGPYPGEDAATRALATVRGAGYGSARLVRPERSPVPNGN